MLITFTKLSYARKPSHEHTHYLPPRAKAKNQNSYHSLQVWCSFLTSCHESRRLCRYRDRWISWRQLQSTYETHLWQGDQIRLMSPYLFSNFHTWKHVWRLECAFQSFERVCHTLPQKNVRRWCTCVWGVLVFALELMSAMSKWMMKEWFSLEHHVLLCKRYDTC